MEVPLSKVLLEGSLIRLAFVNDTVSATGALKPTILTCLDGVRSNERQIGNGAILRKILSLKDNAAETIQSEDENNHMDRMLERLKELVKELVVRVGDKVSDLGGEGDETVRLLQGMDSVLTGVTEVIVTKEDISYTILSLDGSGYRFGDDIIFRGYNLTSLLTTNVTITINISNLGDSINEALNFASDSLIETFQDLYNGLSSLHSQTQNTQESLDDILPYYYTVVVFVSIIMLLTCLFIVGTIVAWKQSSPTLFRCTLDRVLLPIFIICGLLVWIFTSVFLTLGVLNGDFCFDTPDAQMNKILQQTLYHQSRVAYNFAYYYVNGCPSEYQSNLAQFAYARILEARAVMLDFHTLLQDFDNGSLSEACGAVLVSDGGESPVTALGALSFLLLEHLQATSKVVVAFAEVLMCRTFHPLYAVLMYDMVCGDFVNTIRPMLWSCFMISIGSMMMVTLRVAWHELREDGHPDCNEVDEDEKDEICKVQQVD